jgi:hypothetical protein
MAVQAVGQRRLVCGSGARRQQPPAGIDLQRIGIHDHSAA